MIVLWNGETISPARESQVLQHRKFVTYGMTYSAMAGDTAEQWNYKVMARHTGYRHSISAVYCTGSQGDEREVKPIVDSLQGNILAEQRWF
jgi:hypothetical protein